MALPDFFGLKSNYKNEYVQYVNEDGEVHGFLKASGENLVSPYTKFHVEKAKTGKGLVHIRCCYNNKYWRQLSPSQWWIVAEADEPEEDTSKWSCTLFEPLAVDREALTFHFRHFLLKHYVCVSTHGNNDEYDLCLSADSNSVDKAEHDVFTVIDWNPVCILPTYVAFKGDNEHYLAVHKLNDWLNLRFLSTNITLAESYKVTPAADGYSSIIISKQKNKCWKRTSIDPYWISVDQDDSSSVTPDSLFQPYKVHDNTVALKNMGTGNHFCKRINASNYLSANSNTISAESILKVEDLATSRNMNDVIYHLKDARIYNRSVDQLLTTRVNRTNEPVTVKLNYLESKSQAWKANVSLLSGVRTNIQASIPVIAADGLTVEISANSAGEFEWGRTIESNNISEVVHEVTMPPMTQVKVNLLATKASCDVPFSYSQRDTSNGEVITLNKADGIFHGRQLLQFQVRDQRRSSS